VQGPKLFVLGICCQVAAFNALRWIRTLNVALAPSCVERELTLPLSPDRITVWLRKAPAPDSQFTQGSVVRAACPLLVMPRPARFVPLNHVGTLWRIPSSE
jgi:hypothetical protein